MTYASQHKHAHVYNNNSSEILSFMTTLTSNCECFEYFLAPYNFGGSCHGEWRHGYSFSQSAIGTSKWNVSDCKI